MKVIKFASTIIQLVNQMSQRFTQQEKFKNISLKLDQIPMHTSNIVRVNTTGEGKDNYRPSTPINSNKYIHEGKHFNVEITTSQINHERVNSNNSSPKVKSQIKMRQQVGYDQDGQNTNKNQEAYVLKRELQQKEEIISELKGIIKLSNENNSRIKPKSLYQKSPSRERTYDDDQKQLRELRHNVKVLTIENNALSGYIDKLKYQMEQNNAIKSRLAGTFQREHRQGEIISSFRQQNQSLKKNIAEKDSKHQKKIDEYISTYKSLANQCKRLQHLLQESQQQNERLNVLVRDLEQTHRKTASKEQDKLGKTMMSQKLSIIKIKQQYAESIKTIKETIQIQFENIFDNFRNTLNAMDDKLSYFERRIRKIEDQFKHKPFDFLKLSREATKKSQIYIEQGSESYVSQNSARKNNALRSVAISRLYDESLNKTSHNNNDEELVKPLQQEIGRLKEIISDLQNQMSERSNSYTFRERDESSQAELRSHRADLTQKQEQLKTKQREMIYQINKFKQEIDRLQAAYRQQKKDIESKFKEDMGDREDRIRDLQNELHQVRSKYEQCLDEMKNIIDIKRAHQDFQQEITFLRKDNEQYLNKIEQYKKLCNLLQQQTKENTINYQIFNEMKNQIFEIKQRYHYDIVKFNATEKQNQQILIANEELKMKLQQSIANFRRLKQENEKLQQGYKLCQTQRQQLIHRANYNQKIIKILQNQIKAKKDIQLSLIEEKNSLEKQLINYLSIFNKLTFEELKSSNKTEKQQLGIEELLNKLQKLEASFNELHSSKREKRQIISRLMNGSIDEVQLSSIKRKG